MSIWTTPEREDLRKTVRAFAEREVLPHVDEWERLGELPRDLHRMAAQAGLLGAGFPEAVGGEGGDAADVPIASLLGTADAAKGAEVFKKCAACHKLDGANAVGPHLNGVVGRAIASVGGFGYSDGLKALAAKSWTPEELDHWLENPKGYAPGNKMSFAGLPKVEDRANLVAYLASLQ